MLDMPTPQDKSTPHPQMSNKELQELIRPHVPVLIQKALDLVENADNSSVSLGAIKLLLAKVLPDLKSQELTGKDGVNLIKKITIEVDGKASQVK